MSSMMNRLNDNDHDIVKTLVAGTLTDNLIATKINSRAPAGFDHSLLCSFLCRWFV